MPVPPDATKPGAASRKGQQRTQAKRKPATVEARGRLWMDRAAQSFAGPGRVQLLEEIAQRGSIRQAALAMGMGYKSAWDAVDAMNQIAGRPLVTARTGGKQGGGAVLTDLGNNLVQVYRQLEREYDHFLQDATARLHLSGELYSLMRNLRVRTSARNQLFGQVHRVTTGAVNSSVQIALSTGELLTAIITNESCAQMGLAPGADVYALVKANFVMLATGDAPLTVSAANCLPGTISAMQEGAVNAEVQVRLPGGAVLVAIVTMDSLKRLQLQTGAAAQAIINASDIILGIS